MPPVKQVAGIGRIVHYGRLDGSVVAGIITAIHADKTVALHIFSVAPGGDMKVHHVPFSERNEPGFWTWPPRN